MARCGCQGAASSSCEAIVLCVAAALGPGLMYNAQTGKIQIRRSRDPGNCFSFGSDQGAFSACDQPPNPGFGASIDNLAEQVVAGANGGAGLVHAFASPRAIEYAIANRIDLIDCFSFTLEDDVAAWSPFGPDEPMEDFTSNPTSAPAEQLTSDMWTAMVSDCGDPVNPTGRNSGARPEDLTPDGGWYGFYQPDHRLMTTSEALGFVAGRTCVILQHGHEGDADVAANINAISRVQGGNWCMPSLGTTGLEAVQTYIDSGVPHVCINISGDTETTPQAVVDSGATWVKIRDTQEPERIESFVAAGLNVLAGYSGRQTTGKAMFELGVRGLISQDPVYQRGAIGPDWYQYRTPEMTFGSRVAESGLLTKQTDGGDVLGARGYAEQDEWGRFFPSEFGWEGGTPVSTNTMLLGKYCPLPSPEGYRLRMSVQVDQDTLPSGNAPKLGWVFSSDNDLDPSYPIDGTPPPNRHGYAGFIRVGESETGQLVIGMYNSDGEYTELAAADSHGVSANAWVTLELEVTNPTITLRRTDGANAEVTVDDTTWRGEYVFHMWEDELTSGEGFYHGFQENYYSTLTPEVEA